MSSATLNGRHPAGTILNDRGVPFKAALGNDQFTLGGTGYGNYGANMQKNSLLGWMWRGGDADVDIGLNVQVLRERSRDAFMGIPMASGAIETLSTNVIGEGLYPSPNVDAEYLGLDEDAASTLNKEIEEKFEWWACNARECDYEGKYHYGTLQHVIYQSAMLSGDCPVLFPLKPRPDATFDFRLRIIEADRVRDPMPYTPGVNVFSGVELTDEGELAAYHVANFHPLALQTFRMPFQPLVTQRIEPFGALSGRRNMVLVMRPERPEQRRGVPILSVCLELLKQMGRYIDAVVLGAVIQSYFTAFITSDFPDPNIFDSMLTDAQKAQVMNFNPYNVQLGPGIVNFMRPGHAVNFANPTQPQSTFGEFSISVAKFVGAALGIPYEVLLKMYNSSYSASRAAQLDFWKRVRMHRMHMINGFCQPAYEEWMADAVGLGQIESFKADWNDPAVRRAMTRCTWTGSSAGSIDPEKEVAAADLKIKCGLSTLEREASELQGADYKDVIRQQSREQKEYQEAGLVYPPYRASGGGEGGKPPGAPGQKPVPGEAPAPEAPAPEPYVAPSTPAPKKKARYGGRLRTAVEMSSSLTGRFSR